MLCSCSFSHMQDHCQRRNYALRTLEGSPNPLGLGGSLTSGAGPRSTRGGPTERCKSLPKAKILVLAKQHSGKARLESAEVKHCLQQNWESGLHLTASGCFYSRSGHCSQTAESCLTSHLLRTQVAHDDFIDVLDLWLKKYRGNEQEFSNNPFT
jgi:hypothetical protein